MNLWHLARRMKPMLGPPRLRLFVMPAAMFLSVLTVFTLVSVVPSRIESQRGIVTVEIAAQSPLELAGSSNDSNPSELAGSSNFTDDSDVASSSDGDIDDSDAASTSDDSNDTEKASSSDDINDSDAASSSDDSNDTELARSSNHSNSNYTEDSDAASHSDDSNNAEPAGSLSYSHDSDAASNSDDHSGTEVASSSNYSNDAQLQQPVTASGPDPAMRKASDANNSHNSSDELTGPYQNWELFAADYEEMLHNLKIYVYPDAYMKEKSSPFSNVFLPLSTRYDRKLGNYFSEHAFKAALLRSPLLTARPEEAHFFFMPFSINVMRYHPRLHTAASITDFVAGYTARISSEFKFWNASGGADHFYACCHSIGRTAASKRQDLQTNAIQLTCSSNYFQRLYFAHKDVGLPQVWPRPPEKVINPPDARDKLVFFSGRKQNSLIREKVLETWENDPSLDIYSGNVPFLYAEGFRRSRYCLSVKGYEVNTARVSDAIHFGCIPVIISNYYDLPLANVLDWSKFSIIIREEDVPSLKKILLSVSRETYLTMFNNLSLVRRHFRWHTPPKGYDSFYMTAYQLWLRRGLHRTSY